MNILFKALFKACFKYWKKSRRDGQKPRVNDAAWENAETFDQLIELNKLFLQGKLEQTPFLAGMDKPTKKISKDLIKLHDCEILAVGYLEFLNTTKIRQHPGIDCLMEIQSPSQRERAERMMEILEQHSEVKVHRLPVYREQNPQANIEYIYGEENDNGRWKTISGFKSPDNKGQPVYFEDEDCFRKLKALRETKVLYFMVTAKVWGQEPNICGIIKKASQTADGTTHALES
jgi:hypothetical protein